jgi:hypothetical protein
MSTSDSIAAPEVRGTHSRHEKQSAPTRDGLNHPTASFQDRHAGHVRVLEL